MEWDGRGWRRMEEDEGGWNGMEEDGRGWRVKGGALESWK